MLTQEELKKTPLYDEHLTLKARMVPFGGWELPVQYNGILAEHAHTREKASVFDISHMGEFIVEGDCVESGLDRLATMSLVDLPVKACRYGCLLNEQGGVIDDLIIFRIEQNKWFIVVNGATTLKDAEHIQKHLSKDAQFTDVTMQTGKLDLQGPASRDVLKSLVEGIEKLDYFQFDFFDLLGKNVLISRTGYTGELGYEIFYPWDHTKNLWRDLLKNDMVKPAGLGARDILRLEVGYSLYGHELKEDISPLESGLNRFIHLDKDFIGKNALLKQKEEELKQKIVGISSETRRAPREGHRIYLESGEEIGLITSGAFSPSVNKGIGLGFVVLQYANPKTAVLFGDDKNKNPAAITSRTFYKNGSLRDG